MISRPRRDGNGLVISDLACMAVARAAATALAGGIYVGLAILRETRTRPATYNFNRTLNLLPRALTIPYNHACNNN